MKTVKLSYSILNSWSMGRFEDAVATYLGKPYPSTDAMELGKTMGKIWENHINSTHTLPIEFGGDKLYKPVCEQKYRKRIPFSDQYEILISGMPDCTEDEVIIHENKCGKTEVSAYIDSKQLNYYKLLIPKATLGIYHIWNPYLKTYQRGIKYLTTQAAEEALEHIITYGGEMINYLEANRLIIDFKEY